MYLPVELGRLIGGRKIGDALYSFFVIKMQISLFGKKIRSL